MWHIRYWRGWSNELIPLVLETTNSHKEIVGEAFAKLQSLLVPSQTLERYNEYATYARIMEDNFPEVVNI